jgi:PmbA protein
MPKNDHLDLARWACEQARKAGAREARASVFRVLETSLEYRERKVETLSESTQRGLSLSLYSDGKYSAHRTSDLRKPALETFIGEAVAMTRYLTEDEYRRLPEPEYYEGRQSLNLDLVDPGQSKVVPDDRHRVARDIEGAALNRGGDRIISVTAGYSEYRSESAMVATNGFEGTSEQTSFWCGAEATAKDDGDRRPEDWWWEGRRYRKDLSDPQSIGRQAVDRALRSVGSDKIPTEELPILVENRAAGRLVGFYRSALSGSSLQQRRSFLEGKLGEKVLSEHLSVYDDPFIARGQGSRLFDGEGIAARKMPVFEKGVLANFYIDTYYGRKLGMRATTGGPSNLVFQSDTVKSVEEWMRELQRGIFITSFLGGNSNSSTGDFSAGIQGFLFEEGAIVRPISAMNLAGNHLEFWHKLLGIGNDAYEFSSIRTPSLVFDRTVVAGA